MFKTKDPLGAPITMAGNFNKVDFDIIVRDNPTFI
jgi:hypothetical protein